LNTFTKFPFRKFVPLLLDIRDIKVNFKPAFYSDKKQADGRENHGRIVVKMLTAVY